MHPSLTYDLLQADHRERLEASRLAARQAAARPVTESRGRPPDRARRPRLRPRLAAVSTAGPIR
jgi:hypothetical protein